MFSASVTVGINAVRKELHGIRDRWYDVGMEHDLDHGTLESIKQNFQDVSDRVCEMIASWLKEIHPPPTWKALVNTLESCVIGEEQLTQRLRSKYCALGPGEFLLVRWGNIIHESRVVTSDMIHE